MTTIVTRAAKGTPLTHAEGDANFTNLNNNKVETSLVAVALGLATLNASGLLLTSQFPTAINVATATLAATVTTNANLAGPITSDGNTTSVAAQTGTGSVFVMQASPTLTTPNIGAATGTSLATTGGVTAGGSLKLGSNLLEVRQNPAQPFQLEMMTHLTINGVLGIGITANGSYSVMCQGASNDNTTFVFAGRNLASVITSSISSAGAATLNSVTLSGNISAPAWTTTGLRIKGIAATLTDTTSTGVVAAAYTDAFGGNTIAASNATTYTHYTTAFFNEPVAGTNVTMTNKWALGAASARFGTSTQLTVGLNGALTSATTAALTTAAESWVGPSATTGVYFKGGFVGIGLITPTTVLEVFKTGSGSSSKGVTFRDSTTPTYAANADNLLTVRGTGLSTSTWRGRVVAGGDNVAFLMGEFNSQAWLGAHNAALGAWADIYVNPAGAANLFLGAFAAGAVIIAQNSNGFVSLGVNTPAARFHVGAASPVGASWTTNGIGVRIAADAYTDSSTAASGTAVSNHIHTIAAPVLAATNTAVTTTNAATLYIAGAPTAGANMTITNPLALHVASGSSLFNGKMDSTTSAVGIGSTITGAIAGSFTGTYVNNTDVGASALAAIVVKTGNSATQWQFFARGGDLFFGAAAVVDAMRLTTSQFILASNYPLSWGSSTTSTPDVFLSRSAAATLQQGAANAAAPVAQTLQSQGSRAGTDTNIGGASYTIQSGIGTGTGAASSLIFRAPVVVASGTGAQTMTTALTLGGTYASFAVGVTAPTIASSTTVAAASAGNGTVVLNVGSASGSGYVYFNSAAGVRQGFIGFSTTTATTDAGTIPYVAGTHAFTGLVSTPASTTSNAGLRVIHGAAPTTPVDGDIWTTTAGMFVRINGATVGPLT